MALVDECRLCGTDTLDKERYSIFEGEGRTKKYARKIEDFLRVQVCDMVQSNCGRIYIILGRAKSPRGYASFAALLLIN
jgi:hypothetical protein